MNAMLGFSGLLCVVLGALFILLDVAELFVRLDLIDRPPRGMGFLLFAVGSIALKLVAR